jgi:hypothetical protein
VLAADRDHLAGHVAGVVAGQEDHDVGDLPGLGGAAERLAAGQVGEQVRAGDLGQEGVQGQARGHGVDADVMAGDVEGGAAGEGHHAGLGRGVVGLAGLGPPAQDRGVVDHRAAVALGDHLAQRGPGAAERAGQRHVEDLPPLLVGQVEDRGGAAQAGVVDQHVDAAEVRGGGGDQRFDLRFVGDVAGVGPDLAAVGPGQFLAGGGQAGLVLVADHHLGAFVQAAAGGGAADAGAGRGGDDHDLAVEQLMAVHGLCLFPGNPRARVAMMLRWISSDPP